MTAKSKLNKTQQRISKEKETIYYILKTTYKVSHWTTIYIELCDSVTLGLVIYLLYILSYREREGWQTIVFLFVLVLIFLQLKKNRSLTLQDKSGDM